MSDSKKINIARIATVGVFSALAFAGGYLFIAIPNIEIFTAFIFLSGLLLGAKSGVLVGLIAQSLYSTLNPYGISPLPLFLAQVLMQMLVGFVGGKFQGFSEREKNFKLLSVLFAITGLLLTWLYDVMTDFSSFFISGFSFEQMKVTFTLGLLWYITHGVGNTLIFALVLPFVSRGVRGLELLKTVNRS